MELELQRCKFKFDGPGERWLSDLNMKVTKLDIIDSDVTAIFTNAFNSDVFTRTLSHLKIDNSMNASSEPFVFQMFSRESFNGLSTLNELTITNNPTLSIVDPFVLSLLNDSLTHLTISRIVNPWPVGRALSQIVLNKIKVVDLQVSHDHHSRFKQTFY